MSTWKLSIKTGNHRSDEAFDLCKEKSIVAIGWSDYYRERRYENIDKLFAELRLRGDNIPPAVNCLAKRVRKDDFIWIHQRGEYHLCKVRDEQVLLGSEITPDFLHMDVGHARNVEWVTVPVFLVPGKVLRGTISPRTIQQIGSEPDVRLEKYFGVIHGKLLKNKDWKPDLDDSHVTAEIRSPSQEELLSMMSPQDLEDIVAAYLQREQGWTLLHSTWFKSRPEFEFTMVKPGPKYGFVQIKSGDISLSPEEYSVYLDGKDQVILFSTSRECPYPGVPVSGVTTLDAVEVIDWIGQNTWVLSPWIKAQLLVRSGKDL